MQSSVTSTSKYHELILHKYFYSHCSIQVDLGSLQDNVPTDKIVGLEGGWSPFGRRSAGEILLRLTYRAYVEDEEDERAEVESMDMDPSDDELLDIDELNVSYDGSERDSSDKESLMDVLSALIVSEEFRGIVSSETGSPKANNDLTSTYSEASRSRGSNVKSVPSVPDSSTTSSEGIMVFIFFSGILICSFCLHLLLHLLIITITIINLVMSVTCLLYHEHL